MNPGSDKGIVFVVLKLPQLPLRKLLVASSALAAFCAVSVVHAQTAVSLVSQPVVNQPMVSQSLLRFIVENQPRVQPVTYSLQIAADGSGIYRESFSNDGGTLQQVELAVHIHEPLLSRLFQTVRSRRFFAECEPLARRVAFTGKKTVEYTGPSGAESCTFNYSSEKAANEVADQLMAVAYTLQEGVRLNRDHRYDRLSLYDELALLKDAARDHRALELENIAPELESIAQDDEVMNIARRRAQALLQNSQK